MIITADDAGHRLHALIEGIDACLADLTPLCPAIAHCRNRLASLGLSPARYRPTAGRSNPQCGCFDEALTLAHTQGSADLVDLIERASGNLPWTTYEYPGQSIGPRFARAHAFAELVGPGMPFAASDFSLGLFLVAPRTFYRDHSHPAPELYVPLTGPTHWRFDHGAWLQYEARQPIWNASGKVHATLVEAAPFLCIYVWTRDVCAPAAVVGAPDWDEIERRL
jgi:hypothetical protein